MTQPNPIDPQLAALLEAEAILHTTRQQLLTQTVLWAKLYHASRYIQNQIDAYFSTEAA
jgi:hypothetical protein